VSRVAQAPSLSRQAGILPAACERRAGQLSANDSGPAGLHLPRQPWFRESLETMEAEPEMVAALEYRTGERPQLRGVK